jgi:hypothetical protein
LQAARQQAWGHTLTRLWAVLPQQDWQPAPPEGLEGSGALNPVLTPSAEPSGPFRQLHQPALEGLQIGQPWGNKSSTNRSRRCTCSATRSSASSWRTR